MVLTNCVEGQVQPFWLDTVDGERLFCWHILPLDVYLQHESELMTGAGGIAEDLKETIGARLLSGNGESKVVVNFHGVGWFGISSVESFWFLSGFFLCVCRRIATLVLASQSHFTCPVIY